MQRLDSVREQFLTNLESLQRRIADTQARISSGRRVSKPSDDPSAVADVLQLEFDSSRLRPLIRTASEPQIPWAQERRKVRLPSCSYFTRWSRSRTRSALGSASIE